MDRKRSARCGQGYYFDCLMIKKLDYKVYWECNTYALVSVFEATFTENELQASH
jgi:hypothetical protein